VAVDGRHGRAAARAYLDASGRDEDDLAEVAARAQRNGAFSPYAVRFGVIDAQQVLAQPVTHDPLRDADIAPITDGTAAVVIAAGDLARSVCERPAWIKALDHRIEAHGLGVRDSRRRTRRRSPRSARACTTAISTSPSCTRSSATRS